MAGVSTCCRLKASNCLVKEAARLPRFFDFQGMLDRALCLRQLPLEHSAVADDYTQKIVEVMGDSPQTDGQWLPSFAPCVSCLSRIRFSVTSSAKASK